MRIDKRDPRLVYRDFWDWLRTGTNVFWLVSLLWAYILYLITTEEA